MASSAGQRRSGETHRPDPEVEEEPTRVEEHVGHASISWPPPQGDPTNPSHYRSHPSGIECITITEHMSFCLGNAVKYIWRSPHSSTPETDLRKAIWYINRELKRNGQ
jgi:Protein of unknwon function (DUF3310)